MIQSQCNCQERGKDNMRKEDVISYRIDTSVLKNYVESINSITEPMIQIKAQLNQLTKPMQKELKSINNMSNVIKKLLIKYPNDKQKYLQIL